MNRALSRVGLALAAVVSLVALAFAMRLACASRLTGSDPGIWYEAMRLHRGLPLFFDARRGLLDDGPVAIHTVAMYTPVWPWLLSLLPAFHGAAIARVTSVLLFFSGLLYFAVSGRPELRRRATLAALSFSALFFLTRTSIVVASDVAASFVSCLALSICMARRRATAWATLLLAVAAIVKPQVIGVGVGVLVADVYFERFRSARAWLLAGAFTLATLAAFQLGSHGAWWGAFRLTTQNGMNLYRWRNYLVDYALFLGVPHLAVALLARRHEAAPRYGTFALVATVLWNAFAMGKYGSATNYWLEPTFALVVVLGRVPFPLPAVVERWKGAIAVAIPAVVLALGVAPLRTLLRGVEAEEPLLTRIRAACPVDRTHTLIANTRINGLELALTDKLVFLDWALAFSIRKGDFPIAVMRDALLQPATVCLLHTRDVSAPYRLNDPASEASVYDVELADAIRAEYTIADTVDGVYVYKRR